MVKNEASPNFRCSQRADYVLFVFGRFGRRVAERHRLAKNFAQTCLPFLKKEFHGEIPNLISKRGDGRTR